MRPGDVVSGTVAPVTITGMQWKVQLRGVDGSSVVLTVLARRPNGRKIARDWTIDSAIASPSDAQIINAMLQVEATAEADIVSALS
jgi:hypothetical protein